MAGSASTFAFEVASPERVVLKTRVRQVSVPTTLGEITVLPEHVPLVALLKPGIVEAVTESGEREVMAVSGGFIEVLAGKVVILADTAERAQDLEEERIILAQERARTLKEQAQHLNDVEFARLSALIEKEIAREQALKKWRKINLAR